MHRNLMKSIPEAAKILMSEEAIEAEVKRQLARTDIIPELLGFTLWDILVGKLAAIYPCELGSHIDDLVDEGMMIKGEI